MSGDYSSHGGTVPSDSILDGQLLVRLDLGPSPLQNDAFAWDRANFAHLINQLLIYDRVLIPTYDLGIVPALLQWIGLEALRDLIADGSICFVRYHGQIGYAGNGNGISIFRIAPDDERPFEAWWQEAVFRETPIAIEQQLINQRLSLSSQERSDLVRAVVASTIEPTYSNEEFIRHVVNESYRDIVTSPQLRASLRSHYKLSDSPVDVARLPDVGPAELRVLAAGHVGDGPQLVVRVAEVNYQVLICSVTGGPDFHAGEGTQDLLIGKALRAGLRLDAADQFAKILQLNDLPDVGAAVAADEIPLARWLAMRSSTAAVDFRRWLQTVSLEDDDSIIRALLQSLREEPRSSRLPVRLLRLVATSLAGMMGPGTGIVSAAVDSLFVDRWLNGYSPRVILDQVNVLRTD